jgi:hypothetical protein
MRRVDGAVGKCLIGMKKAEKCAIFGQKQGKIEVL